MRLYSIRILHACEKQPCLKDTLRDPRVPEQIKRELVGNVGLVLGDSYLNQKILVYKRTWDVVEQFDDDEEIKEIGQKLAKCSPAYRCGLRLCPMCARLEDVRVGDRAVKALGEVERSTLYRPTFILEPCYTTADVKATVEEFWRRWHDFQKKCRWECVLTGLHYAFCAEIDYLTVEDICACPQKRQTLEELGWDSQSDKPVFVPHIQGWISVANKKLLHLRLKEFQVNVKVERNWRLGGQKGKGRRRHYFPARDQIHFVKMKDEGSIEDNLRYVLAHARKLSGKCVVENTPAFIKVDFFSDETVDDTVDGAGFNADMWRNYVKLFREIEPSRLELWSRKGEKQSRRRAAARETGTIIVSRVPWRPR